MRLCRPARAPFSAAALLCAIASLPCPQAAAPDPIVYTLRFPAPDTHSAEVEAIVPTDGHATIELMLPVWSPGFYGAGNYARNVQEFTARSPDGATLAFEKPRENHWRLATSGAARVVIAYHLLCQSTFVTGSWVGPDFAVINGPSTFITLVEHAQRPHTVQLVLPPVWEQSVTSLAAAPDGRPNEYSAPDYDVFADAPIVRFSPAVSCVLAACNTAPILRSRSV